MKATAEHIGFFPKGEARELQTKRYKQTRTLRHLVAVSNKPILPDGYRQDLIKALELIPGLEIKPNPALSETTPQIVFLNPRKDKIYIDYNIQRELASVDLSVIEEIAKTFDWGQFKVPNLVEVPEWGKFFCTDGQKTTIAAMYNNLKIPFLKTIESPETYIKRQSVGFIGINFKRTQLNPTQLFSALYYRGDEKEIALSGILRRFGIKPRANTGGRIKRNAEPLHTTCIGIFRKLHGEKDKKTFEVMCKIIVGVGYKPIRKVHLDALNIISHRAELKDLDIDRMVNAILSINDSHALLLATANARKLNSRTGMISKELADIYMSNYKKPVSSSTLKPY